MSDILEKTMKDPTVVKMLASMKPAERTQVESMLESILGPFAKSMSEFTERVENMTESERKEACEVTTGVVDLVIDGAGDDDGR